ncbi:hypothetical protein XENOCAPTIV_009532, partial [Xenoophorus captivus]
MCKLWILGALQQLLELRIRKARKQVKRNLEDIGLELCKEVAEGYRSKPFCCTECRFSSKYYSGYKNHFRNVHRKILDSQLLLNCPYCSFSANRRTLETHVKIFHIPHSFQLNYGNPRASVLKNSAVQGNRLEKPMYFCKKCKFRDTLYNVVRRHIYREHFQHIVSPYHGRVSASVKNGACSVNGNNIFCKQCPFSTRSYEALVQHVVEYHERIGSQVTTMIGHANVMMSKPQPTMNEKAALIIKRSKTPRPEPATQPVIGYLKPTVKSQRSVPANPKRVTVNANGASAQNNQTSVNTAQTQKWKICTVCNELFPENLYSAHFECAHKAKKVWALAKYIMKIHNFTSKCLLCNRYLPSNTLLNHMLIHGLTCPQCHSAFHSVEKIMEHTAKTHPDEFVGPSGASPLTFDLTIKQSKPTNIQLAVLTFNMKESPNGQDQSAPALQYGNLPGKLQPVRIVEKQSEPRSLVSLIQNSDVGKTVCPLCFSILKGPLSDALAMHLRQRHQVIQTMHPVENKMTYKCIHCLGVYTSNMVASTITLHLVQCRAVGRNQSSQGFKSTMTLNSAGAGILKRQLPTQSPSNPKKIKMSKKTGPFRGSSTPFDNLVLDPSGCEHKTHEARKDFLTAYFNRRPYPTSQEVEKLAASMWLWKSEVASHFALKRNLCLKSCETKKLLVRVGLDMNAVGKLKHYLIFDKGRLVGTSTVRSTGLKSHAPYTKPKPRPHQPNHTVEHSGLRIEIISIDSDNEEEMENPVQMEEFDINQDEHEKVNTNHEDNVESKCLENLTEEREHVEMDDPLREKSMRAGRGGTFNGIDDIIGQQPAGVTERAPANCPNSLLRSEVAGDRTEGEKNTSASSNGPLVNSKAGPLRKPWAPRGSIEALKSALKDSADEFERLFTQSFSHLSLQLDITPDTAYHSFKAVLDELFKDGVNWGRVVGLFAFGGVLCVDCVQRNMSELVSRIADWMTIYLDEQLDPWIHSQGGWDCFAKLYGQDAAAEGRRFQETLDKWLLVGAALLTGVLLAVL